MWTRLISFLSWVYKQVWSRTTGRKFTYIMRERPYLFAIPAIGIIGILFVVRRVLKLDIHAVSIGTSLFLGVVAGHTFWGNTNTSDEVKD